jgi:hypothetical protein
MIGNKKSGFKKWEVEQRLRFIEFRLFWEGGINRAHLMEYFRISSPQASADLSRYQDLAPENMVYDTRSKIYKMGPRFKPVLGDLSSEKFLLHVFAVSSLIFSRGHSFLGDVPEVEVVPTPHRSIDSSVLSKIYRALTHNYKIQALYKSMGKSEPTSRWIYPTTLAYDGFRWHIRGYCFNDDSYKDFVISRFQKIQSESKLDIELPIDIEWEEYVVVCIKPHPKLSEEAQRTIELDYGMLDGEAKMEVRRAMLIYTLKNLGLENKDHVERNPKEQHIILKNPHDIYSLF